jgi:hypothetical protein
VTQYKLIHTKKLAHVQYRSYLVERITTNYGY